MFRFRHSGRGSGDRYINSRLQVPVLCPARGSRSSGSVCKKRRIIVTNGNISLFFAVRCTYENSYLESQCYIWRRKILVNDQREHPSSSLPLMSVSQSVPDTQLV